MHILAALTDAPAARITPAQTKRGEPETDFETAFLSAGEPDLAHENGAVLADPGLGGGEETDISVDDALPENPETDELSEFEMGDIVEDIDGSVDTVEALTVPEHDLRVHQGNTEKDTPKDAAELVDAKPIGQPASSINPQNPVSREIWQIATPAVDQKTFPVQLQPVSTRQPQTVSATQNAAFLDQSIEMFRRGPAPFDFEASSTIMLPAVRKSPVFQSLGSTTSFAVTPIPAALAEMVAAGPLQHATDKRRDLLPGLTPAVETLDIRSAMPVQSMATPPAVAVDFQIRKPAVMAADPMMSMQNPVSGDESLQITSLGRVESAQVQPAIQSQTLQHPHMPQHVARQMAEALQKGGNGPVDVALNPEELGRVRMRITVQDGGIVINILAERAETLDLMRRNSDQLGQEFEDMGFGSVSFGFSATGQDAPDTEQHSGESNQSLKSERDVSLDHPEAPAPSPQSHVTQGVDIRL